MVITSCQTEVKWRVAALWYILQARAKENLWWNIQQAQAQLGSEVYTHLPFSHPLLGCDKASRVQGIGKGVCIEKLSPSYLVDQARSFSNPNSAKDEVISAGEKI